MIRQSSSVTGEARLAWKRHYDSTRDRPLVRPVSSGGGSATSFPRRALLAKDRRRDHD